MLEELETIHVRHVDITYYDVKLVSPLPENLESNTG